MAASLSVLCVDTDAQEAGALRAACAKAEIEWSGWCPVADEAPREIARTGATVLAFDIDTAGANPIAALTALAAEQPQLPIIVFGTDVGGRLLNEALDAGASRYVNRSSGLKGLVRAIRDAVPQRTYWTGWPPSLKVCC